jgi:RNA polymerase sigma factor (sigma-70 family)
MLKPDIRGLQADDQFMWEAAYFWLWPVARSAARRKLGPSCEADVEDVASAAIVEAAEQVGDVSSFEELKALTGIIARRRAVDHIRRMQAERRGGGRIESLAGREEEQAEERDPLAEVDSVELARVVARLLSRLSPKQRDLLRAYHQEGLTQAEIAERFGIPPGTVAVTLSRGLRALRTELERHPRLLKELKERLR